MGDIGNSIAELLRQDRRYRFDAYVFVFESLRFAQEVLGYGTVQTSGTTDGAPGQLGAGESSLRREPGPADEEAERQERHVTGQELCEAIRLYALEQFGYMAKCVLNNWGVAKTGDFGEIVFNLIKIGHMRKTDRDRRKDFEDVYDFETGFQQNFHFPSSS
ncbi:MAG: hypothetical protein BMS9Abin04_350 [Planctomycetia bacterium]|nr:MAG: hypothetical protein BMS9Abin04_350 [Planctomycetia bacterium]